MKIAFATHRGFPHLDADDDLLTAPLAEAGISLEARVWDSEDTSWTEGALTWTNMNSTYMPSFPAGYTIGRFLRARLIVQTRVNHAAIVPGLMSRQLGFGLENHHRVCACRRQLHRGGCAHDAAAYDGQVIALHLRSSCQK